MQRDREAASLAEIARRTSQVRSASILVAFPLVVHLGLLCACVAWLTQDIVLGGVDAEALGLAFAAPIVLVLRLAPMLNDWWLTVRRDDWVKAIAQQYGLTETDVRELLDVFE